MENKLLGVIFFLVLLVGFGLGTKYFTEKQAQLEIQKRVDKVINASSAYADISYKKIKVNLLKQEYTVLGITAKSAAFPGEWKADALRVSQIDRAFLKKVVFGEVDPEKDFPLSIRFELVGLEVPPEVLPEDTRANLVKIGYKQLKFNFSWDYLVDPAAETLGMNLSGKMQSGGELKFAITLGSVEFTNLLNGLKKLEGAKDPSALAPLAYITLNSLEFGYVDNSLVSRLNWFFYQKQKTTFAHAFKQLREHREQKLADSRIQGDTVPVKVSGDPAEPSPLLKQAMAATQTFLEKPQSISLVAKPEKPTPFMKVLQLAGQGEEAMIHAFGVQVIANGG